MSHSIRFLGLAILAWAGVRAVSLGMVPGMKALAFDLPSRSTAAPASRLPAIQPTELPPIEPVSPAVTYPPNGGVSAMAYQPYGAYPPYAAYGPYPVYVPVPAASPRNSSPQIIYVNPPVMQPPEINVYGGGPDRESAPQKLAMAEPIPQMQSSPQWKSTPSIAEASQPGRLDRLSLSSWAMLRDQPGSQSLASGGTLGGSQAGVRLLWKFNPHIAASLRTNAPINGQRSAEVALGARFQPFVSWPIAFTVERRQSVGRYGGQDAFAVFAEGGAYGRPMPWNSTLDAYLQTGIVGAKRRDWFVDGSAALTRPVWRNVSAGFGVWGGAQPGLNRLDMGPRASMRVTNKVRVHLDYRQKLLGNAAPGSGGVVTLAGDF
jgi:hypothetical protein